MDGDETIEHGRDDGSDNEEEDASGRPQEADEEEDRPAKRQRRSAFNRERPTTDRQCRLREWCQDNAPVKSGSLDEAHLIFSTYGEAYKAYRKDMEASHEVPYSFSGFYSVLYKWAINPRRYDKYACPLCYALGISKLSADEQACDPHSVRLNRIWPIYRNQVDELRRNNAKFILVIMDYSRVHELGAVSSQEGGQRTKLSILNFTVVLNGNEEHFFDFFATGKQGKDFMRQAMQHVAMYLKEWGQNHPIMLWSDGGLKSYGTVSNVLELSGLLKKTIVHRYFPAYHGHSRCDAHFGRGKRLLRKHFPIGGLSEIPQVVETFHGLPSTVTELLTNVPVSDSGNWAPWGDGKGIRSVDSVKYMDGQIFVGTVRRDGIESWKKMSIPEWHPSRASLRKLAVTPYTPVASPIPDPTLHRLSFQRDFRVPSARPFEEPSSSQTPSAPQTAFGDVSHQWHPFDPGRCVPCC